MSEKTKEKNKFYNTVVGWACIIWAVASIGLGSFFTGSNQTTFAIMTFGQLFVIFGIILLINKKLSGVVSLFAGMSAIVLPAVNQWGVLFDPAIQGDIIFPIMISTGITVIGAAMLIGPEVLDDWYKRKCRTQVEAEVIDFKETTLSDNETLAFAPVYQYEVNGKLFVKESAKYSSRNIPRIGDRTSLLINEKRPEEVYFPTSKASKMIIYLLGIGFFLAGCGMLIVTLGL
ncbi:MAG: hypothetical protein K6D97_08555 [Clostridia bacterium]|nr:hypothetical protein [Clostridia bacterium]